MMIKTTTRENLEEEINLIYDEGKDDEIEDCKDYSGDSNGYLLNHIDNNNINNNKEHYYSYDKDKTTLVDTDEDVVILSLIEHFSKSTLEEEQLKRVMKESKMEAEAINRSLGNANNKDKRVLQRNNRATSYYDLRKRNTNVMTPIDDKAGYDIAMKEAIKKSLVEANDKFENMVSIQPSKKSAKIHRLDSAQLFDLAVEEALKRSLEEVATTMSEENIRNVNNYFKSKKSFDLDVEFALRKSIEEAAKSNVNVGIDSDYFEKTGLSEKTQQRPLSLTRNKRSFDIDVEEALKATLVEAVNGLSEDKLVAANNYLKHKKSFDSRLEDSLRKSMLFASDINKMHLPLGGIKRPSSYSLTRSSNNNNDNNNKNNKNNNNSLIRQKSLETFQDFDNWGITIDSCTGSIHNSSIYTSSHVSSQTSSPSKRKSGSFYEPTLPTVDEKGSTTDVLKNSKLTEKQFDSELDDPAVKKFMEQREIKRQSLKAESLRKAFEEEAKRLQIDRSVFFDEATKLKIDTSDSNNNRKGDNSVNTSTLVNGKFVTNDLSAATNSVLQLISKDVKANQQESITVDNNYNKNVTNQFKKSFYKSKSFSFCSSRGSFTYKTNSFDESDNETEYGEVLSFGDFDVDNDDFKQDNSICTVSPSFEEVVYNTSKSDLDIYKNESFDITTIVDIVATKQNNINDSNVIFSSQNEKHEKNFVLTEKVSSKSVFNNFYDPVGFYSMKSPTFSSAGQSSISFNGYSSCNNIYEKALNQATHNFVNQNAEQVLIPNLQESSRQDTDLINTNKDHHESSLNSDAKEIDATPISIYNSKRSARLSDVSSFNNGATTDAEESQITPFTKVSNISESQMEMNKNIALTSALTILQKALQNPEVRDDAIQSAVKVLEQALKMSEHSGCSSKSTSIDQSGDEQVNDKNKKAVMVSSAISILQDVLGDNSKNNLGKMSCPKSVGYFNDDLDDDNIVNEPNYMKNLTTRLSKSSSREFRENNSPEIFNNLQKSSSSEIFNKPKVLGMKKLNCKRSSNGVANIDDNQILPTVSSITMTSSAFIAPDNEMYNLKEKNHESIKILNNTKPALPDVEKESVFLNGLKSSSISSIGKLGESFSMSEKRDINRSTVTDTHHRYENIIHTSNEKLIFRPSSDRLVNNRYSGNDRSVNFSEYQGEPINPDKIGVFIDGMASRDFTPTTSSSYKYPHFDNTNEKVPRTMTENKYQEKVRDFQYNDHEARISRSYSKTKEQNVIINRNDSNIYLSHKNLSNNRDDRLGPTLTPTIDCSFDFIDSPFQNNTCTNISPVSSITEDSMDFDLEKRHFRLRESEVIRSNNNFSKSKSVEKLFYKNSNRKSNDIDDAGFWNCYVCTLQNKPTFLTCEACNAVKKNVI